MSTIEFLRQFHVGGYAIFDIVASLLWIYLLSPVLSRLCLKIKIDIPKINRVFLTLPIGILVHLLVGKITPMTNDFLDLHSHYTIKIILLILLVLGVRNIKIIKKK